MHATCSGPITGDVEHRRPVISWDELHLYRPNRSAHGRRIAGTPSNRTFEARAPQDACSSTGDDFTGHHRIVLSPTVMR